MVDSLPFFEIVVGVPDPGIGDRRVDRTEAVTDAGDHELVVLVADMIGADAAGELEAEDIQRPAWFPPACNCYGCCRQSRCNAQAKWPQKSGRRRRMRLQPAILASRIPDATVSARERPACAPMTECRGGSSRARIS